jgi:hypothetical protein
MPDVRVKLEGLLSLRAEHPGPMAARFYDALGNRGVLGITLFLEPGFRGYLAQRLQPIRNDPDGDPFDEYYLEDEGLWRVGKQYLPFGSGRLLRETALAARADTNLIFEGLPVSIAACDAGPGRQRGFIGRVGGRIGASFAIGNHFGISPTSLAYVRYVENSPGKGRGYRVALGGDFSKTFGAVTVRGEGLLLRGGETDLDIDETIFDASVTYLPQRNAALTAGITRSALQEAIYTRLHLSLGLNRNLRLEPLVRFRGRNLYDLNLIVRFSF